MTRVERRVLLWDWLIRRQGSVATKSDAEIIALQARRTPNNAILNRILGSVVPGTVVEDRRIPGADGDVDARVYRPADAGSGVRPLVVYFHGGGFVLGDLRLGDWICSQVAVRVGAVVLSVAYRLAPKYPFPAAVDDCFAAARWAAEHAEELGAAGPMGLMGESAGANLSAVVSLLTRDGGPPIAHQALLYPPTDLTRESASAKPALIIPAAETRAYRRLYLGDADPKDSRVSPLLADDHRGLPPTLIQVAEHDPLRDDGIRYAAALRQAGVKVRLTEYIGLPHGYLNFPGLCRGAGQALAELCAEQSAAFAQAVNADGQ